MRVLTICVLFLLCPLLSRAQVSRSLFDLLDSLGGVKITLTYPFDSLYATNQDEIEAAISIETSSGVLMDNQEITLNLRGKFRRMKCEMPPLELNFKKSTLKKLGLNAHDEIKLVTHCLSGTEGQENLQEEFLCYKMYAAVTEYAYRTIWINVEYHDQLSGKKAFTSAGILIEPDDDVCVRLSLIERKVFNVREDSLSFETYSTAAAFNCLIGNMDWSLVMARNVKLFFDSTAARYAVIPYDFDYSNVVNPSYRRESRPEGMEHPHDRYYQGEYFKGRAPEMLKSFVAFRDKIEQTVNTFDNPMPEARRKRMAKYFSTWFDEVEKTREDKLYFGCVIPYSAGL